MSNPPFPSSIGEYTILPITISPVSSHIAQSIHHIYLRPHTPKIPTATDSRSLFLVNVPIDSTASHFRALFNSVVGAGRFESITFENEKNSSSTSGAEFVSAKTNKKKLNYAYFPKKYCRSALKTLCLIMPGMERIL